MNKPKDRTATVAKYGDFFYLNLDKDNPLRGGTTIGKQTSRTDLAKPYPNWLPEPLKEEAMFTMVNLRRTYTDDQIFDFIALREAASILISQQVPDNAKDKIDALIYIQRLIELGEEKGREAYLGEGSEKIHRATVESRKQSERGAKKSGTVGDLKHALTKISLSIGTTSWPKVKEAIKNRELISELYESATDPINIHDFRLSGISGDRREDREDLLIYTTRDNQPGSKKVDYIRKILSKIKKENNL